MELIRLSNASLAFGDVPLLDKAHFNVNSGERVCIVGRNGAGKSSLMKVLSLDLPLDDGDLQRVNECRVARLEQDPPRHSELSVFDYVAQGIADIGELLQQHHHVTIEMALRPDDEKLFKQLTSLQEQLEQKNGWLAQQRIEQTLEQFQLDGEVKVGDLSGGWQRKVALAKTLVAEPDVLLLDEPTNHLDIDVISWLETSLKQYKGAIVFISHDRSFIRKMATRIIDLDRGVITSFPGDYDEYLKLKDEAVRVEQEQNKAFDKRLAEEEVWVRQGIKARRTRNEGRVRALKALRKERSERLDRQGTTKANVATSGKSGKTVYELKNVSFGYNAELLIDDLSLLVNRGDKIGLIGPNGVGKSTLINLLLEKQQPQQGTIKIGTNLDIAYFDQHRIAIDEEKTVQENVGDGKQEVMVGGKPRHVLGYLQDFLFPPQRARTPVKALSGGEKNRLLLAKLLLKPSNLLILDEPTNDLDIETLELLESILVEYTGSVLLVSHDREFIDNTMTSCLLFKGQGQITEIVGGYTEVEHYLAHQAQKRALYQQKPVEAKPEKTTVTKNTKKKLSYKLAIELESLPGLIEELEMQVEDLQAQVNDPAFFKQPAENTQPLLNQLAEAESKLEASYQRWEELDALNEE